MARVHAGQAERPKNFLKGLPSVHQRPTCPAGFCQPMDPMRYEHTNGPNWAQGFTELSSSSCHTPPFPYLPPSMHFQPSAFPTSATLSHQHAQHQTQHVHRVAGAYVTCESTFPAPAASTAAAPFLRPHSPKFLKTCNPSSNADIGRQGPGIEHFIVECTWAFIHNACP